MSVIIILLNVLMWCCSLNITMDTKVLASAISFIAISINWAAMWNRYHNRGK